MSFANLGDAIDLGEPHRTALIVLGDGDAPRSLTAGELDRRAGQVAAALNRLALPLGTVVGILAENHPDNVPVLLGVMRAGLVACPISWKLPRETIDFILRDADVGLAFGDRARAHLIPRSLPAVDLDQGFDRWLGDEPVPSVVPGEEARACLLYTSGSTGRPKGVPITHAGYGWGLRSFEHDRARSRGTKTLIAAPLYHMNGQCSVLITLFLGGTVVLLRRFDLDLFCRAIGEYRIDEVGGLPTMLAKAIDRMDRGLVVDCSSVTSVTIGSAPLSTQLLARVKARFSNATVSNSYGTTESGFVSFGAPPDGRPVPSVSLGVPLPGAEVRLADGPSDNEGVLEIRTPMTARGYHHRPEETKAKFVGGWYRTGDRMRRDDDGFYYFVGRADDMIVSGGENLYPLEVERVLERHPDVLQAAVVALEDEVNGQVPVAFVVVRVGSATTSEALKEFALGQGPAYAHPRRIELIDELPLAGTNKVDRQALIVRARELWGPG